jgi:hypothetical protein
VQVHCPCDPGDRRDRVRVQHHRRRHSGSALRNAPAWVALEASRQPRAGRSVPEALLPAHRHECRERFSAMVAREAR